MPDQDTHPRRPHHPGQHSGHSSGRDSVQAVAMTLRALGWIEYTPRQAATTTGTTSSSPASVTVVVNQHEDEAAVAIIRPDEMTAYRTHLLRSRDELAALHVETVFWHRIGPPRVVLAAVSALPLRLPSAPDYPRPPGCALPAELATVRLERVWSP